MNENINKNENAQLFPGFYGKECNYWFDSSSPSDRYRTFFIKKSDRMPAVFRENWTGLENWMGFESDNIDSCILWALYIIDRSGINMEEYEVQIQGTNNSCFRLYDSYELLLEDAWRTLTDVNINEADEIEQNWFIFEKGTSKEYIWYWFDERYSKGVSWLVFEMED